MKTIVKRIPPGALCVIARALDLSPDATLAQVKKAIERTVVLSIDEIVAIEGNGERLAA